MNLIENLKTKSKEIKKEMEIKEEEILKGVIEKMENYLELDFEYDLEKAITDKNLLNCNYCFVGINIFFHTLFDKYSINLFFNEFKLPKLSDSLVSKIFYNLEGMLDKKLISLGFDFRKQKTSAEYKTIYTIYWGDDLKNES